MSAERNIHHTMRIDIHPDFLGESLARKKEVHLPRTPGETPPPSVKSRAFAKDSDFDKLLQSVYDAVLICDYEGKIINYNSRAVDFFLCEDNELSGMEMIDLISGADNSLLESIVHNLSDQRYTLIEAFCVRRDDSMFPAEIAVNKVSLNGKGQLCFFIRDISVRKRAQEALEDAIMRLEAHDKARAQFVSNVSHELRTPLTAMIYAVTNMLRGVTGPVSDRTRHYLEMLEGDCKRLHGTVNDILDLRKIDSETLTLVRARTPVSRLVRTVAESFLVQAEQNSVALDIFTDNGRWFVHCDPQKLERVVMNVVGNAIKFTPKQGAVAVAVQEYPNWAGHILISIQDTGSGIPPDAIDKVTERYFMVGEQASGTGLGLAISKEIVELHGGTLELQSPPSGCETGTVVYISMPVVEAPTALLIDDDERILDVLDTQISGQGYRVTKAGSAAEALTVIEKDKPDIVILDLLMPEMEGTEMILKMKSDEIMMNIPIIVLTGANVEPAKTHILNSFSIPALSKPWQEYDLLDRIEGAFLEAASRDEKKDV